MKNIENYYKDYIKYYSNEIKRIDETINNTLYNKQFKIWLKQLQEEYKLKIDYYNKELDKINKAKEFSINFCK